MLSWPAAPGCRKVLRSYPGTEMVGWLSALRRHQQRLESASQRAIVIQFGGAVGTLAALGERDLALLQALAQKLRCRNPIFLAYPARQHIWARCGRYARLVTGTLGKIAGHFSSHARRGCGNI